jgi:hypothetical protein
MSRNNIAFEDKLIHSSNIITADESRKSKPKANVIFKPLNDETKIGQFFHNKSSNTFIKENK